MIESIGERRSDDVGTDEDMSEGRGRNSSESAQQNRNCNHQAFGFSAEPVRFRERGR